MLHFFNDCQSAEYITVSLLLKWKLCNNITMQADKSELYVCLFGKNPANFMRSNCTNASL